MFFYDTQRKEREGENHIETDRQIDKSKVKKKDRHKDRKWKGKEKPCGT